MLVKEMPRIKDAVPIIQKGLSEKKAIIVIGECSVDYVGRASSKLKLGDRIVIIKRDSSILVHRPRDYSPVNWQPPGCLFEIQSLNDFLSIKAVHKKSKETVNISFKRVYTLLVLDIFDTGEFTLYASEEDMQRCILSHPDIIESGLKVISYEKKIEPGFVDVYCLDSLNRLVVVEIKRRIAGIDAVMQLEKYLEAVRKYSNREVRGVLAAPGISRSVQKSLVALNIEFKPLSPKKCAELLRKTSESKSLEKYIT
ncbi:MAG: endonuclease [Thermoproteota archaeon]|nr:endonuclease [Thermoproteota archaeon]